MSGHECLRCRQWVGEGEAHDCWNNDGGSADLRPLGDLQEAREGLRETSAAFSDERTDASH